MHDDRRLCAHLRAAKLTHLIPPELSSMFEENIPVSELALHCEYEKQVAAQAYLYYLEEGRPAGRDREHWLRAEKAVRERNLANVMTVETH